MNRRNFVSLLAVCALPVLDHLISPLVQNNGDSLALTRSSIAQCIAESQKNLEALKSFGQYTSNLADTARACTDVSNAILRGSPHAT